jgi:hypothetical protein
MADANPLNLPSAETDEHPEEGAPAQVKVEELSDEQLHTVHEPPMQGLRPTLAHRGCAGTKRSMMEKGGMHQVPALAVPAPEVAPARPAPAAA